jgi:hypothetical protein
MFGCVEGLGPLSGVWKSLVGQIGLADVSGFGEFVEKKPISDV